MDPLWLLHSSSTLHVLDTGPTNNQAQRQRLQLQAQRLQLQAQRQRLQAQRLRLWLLLHGIDFLLDLLFLHGIEYPNDHALATGPVPGPTYANSYFCAGP